jgi:hypothetical protein
MRWCSAAKSQCQGLQRSQPVLPLGRGHLRTVTHDYYRHGTVTLFAALDYLGGKAQLKVSLRSKNAKRLKDLMMWPFILLWLVTTRLMLRFLCYIASSAQADTIEILIKGLVGFLSMLGFHPIFLNDRIVREVPQ